jgi:hypothetical protein
MLREAQTVAMTINSLMRVGIIRRPLSRDRSTPLLHPHSSPSSSFNTRLSSRTLVSPISQTLATTFSPLRPLIPPSPSCRARLALPDSSSAMVMIVGKRGVSNAVGSGKMWVLGVSFFGSRRGWGRIPSGGKGGVARKRTVKNATHDWKIPTVHDSGIRPSVSG